MSFFFFLKKKTQDSTNFHLEFEGLLEYIRSSRIQTTVEDYDLTTVEDYHLVTVEDYDLTTIEVYHLVTIEGYYLVVVEVYLYYLILI